MSDRTPPSQTSHTPKKKRSFWRLFKSHKKSSSSLQQSAQTTSTAWLDEDDQAEACVRGSPITASAGSLQQSTQTTSTAWLDQEDQAEARVRGSPITASAGSLRPALQCQDSADRPSPLVARGATLTNVLDRHQDQVPDLVTSHLVDELGPSSGDPECVDLLLQPDFPSADHRLPCEVSDTRENDENANLERALIESCGQTMPPKEIVDGGMSNFRDGSSVGNFNSDFIFHDGRSPWSRATHSQQESSDESGSRIEEEEEEEFYDALDADDLGEQFRCETDMKEPHQTATPRGHRTDWSSAIVAVGVAVAIPFFVLVGILHGIYSLFRWGSNVCGQVAGESHALGTTAVRGHGAEQQRDRARPGGPPASAAGMTRPWNACCPRVPSDIRLLLLLVIFPFLIPFMFMGHQNSSSSSSNNNGITSSSPPGGASAGPWRSLRKFVSWLPRRRNATPSSVASAPVTWGAIRGVTRALSAFSRKPRPTFSMARSHHRRGRPCRCRCNKCNVM